MVLGIGTILFAATRMKSDTVPDRELENTIQAFMDEFDQENESLLATIKQLKEELNRETDSNRKRIEALEGRIGQLLKAAEEKPGLSGEEVGPALIFNEHYSRVVAMEREGRTPEQIAKETGIGIGEIQMVLNMVKQGNSL
jgi:cell division septum initiation protein DivIVA